MMTGRNLQVDIENRVFCDGIQNEIFCQKSNLKLEIGTNVFIDLLITFGVHFYFT